MVSTDLKHIMAAHQKMMNISLDADLDADAKLFCYLVLADVSRRRTGVSASERITEPKSWIERINNQAGQPYFCRSVIRKDVPRYQRDPGTGVCVGEMIRREGPCGKKIHQSVYLVDPLTGREVVMGYCTRHWSLDYQDHAQDCRRKWHEHDRPRPPANSGGVLRRHLHTDWDSLYAWADPNSARSEGGKEPVIPRPKLELIRGGA